MSASKITTAQQHQLAVIGAAILDPAACKATVERLTPAMFEDGPYRQLFGAIKLQLDTGHNVDAVILERMLGADFRPLIVLAAETVPTISHVQDYEALVMEDYRKRLLVELATSVTLSAADADSICRDMSEALKVQDHLRRESVDANVKDFSEVWDETMQWLQNRTPASGWHGVSWMSWVCSVKRWSLLLPDVPDTARQIWLSLWLCA